MAKIDEKFIVNLKGKDFILYEGLLDLAHQEGLKSIRTELIQLPTNENNNQCVMKAIAITKDDKHFEGYGDADSSNVNRMIQRHIIRMAETRAKARALRDLTNVGMTALEELGDDSEVVGDEQYQSTTDKQLSDKQIKRLYAIAYSVNIDSDTVKQQVRKKFNKDVKDLTKEEYDAVCNGYESLKK